MKRNLVFSAACALVLLGVAAHAQPAETLRLPSLLKAGKLQPAAGQAVTEIADGSKPGITAKGIVWIKDLKLAAGTIDVDIRGRDVFQHSFLGIAFHGIDTVNFEAVYFRPFNFQSPDSLRRKHTVQYISHPEYTWSKLRTEHPLVYENAVRPVPLAAGWFHARIVIAESTVTVYVNNSSVPSLTIKRLTSRKDGMVGLWTFDLPGDFANLVITR